MIEPYMKYFILLFILLFIPVTPSVVSASEYDRVTQLKRLFTTEYERDQLNRLRDSGKYIKKSANASKTSNISIREPVKVKMQGIVKRKNRKPVIFVNDSNTLRSSSINNEFTVSESRIKANKVPVRINQQSLKLKPGQQWNESSRKTQDNYQIKEANQKPDGLTRSPLSKIIN